MIENLRLRFGKAAGAPTDVIPCTPITVFVGPNNSGKSKVLDEIFGYCQRGQNVAGEVILDRLDFSPRTAADAAAEIASITLQPSPGEVFPADNIIVGRPNARRAVPQQQLVQYVQTPSANPPAFCQWFLVFKTTMLDGRNRITLVQQQPGGDLQQPPHTSFQTLFRDDERRAQLRRITYEAFGGYLVVDPTNLGSLRLRLSPVPPPTPVIERGIHAEAVAFHNAAPLIESLSDGIKAFVGIMSEIVAGDPAVLLIDEPEAFLHPALAFILGQEVSRAAARSPKRIFASTHSANFLMGCVQSGAPVTIIRLTYREGVATARVLDSANILRLMRNPLLRSTDVLSGLFYEAVVVTEADTDRAFYEEVNERLLRFTAADGIRNCLFINAQNKQTVPTILRPLRELGIPAAGIVDIDVLKEGGGVWTSLLSGTFVPEPEHQAAAVLRGEAKSQFEATGRDMKREGGLDLLGGQAREAVENLLQRLAQYGLFVVPGGEVESWLKHLGVMGHGPAWLIPVFERMGEDPDSDTYVRPDDTDVWRFIARVKRWANDPNRRGIPS